MCALLIRGFSRCPICGQLLEEGPFVATSGVAFPPEHHLWKFYDAGLHLHCLEGWPEREAYAQGYFESSYQHHAQGPAGILAKGDSWFLGAGPAKTGSPYHAQIRLKNWPIRLYSRWDDWAENMAGQFVEEYTGQACQEVEAVLQEVRLWAATTKDLNRLRDALFKRD